MEIILASASPRRQELLRQVGVSFRIVPSGIDETVTTPMSPAQLVEHLARSKARDVASRHPEALVLGADTIVVVDERVLGKPRSPEEAIAMLEQLSGRDHLVVTGIALIQGDREEFAHEETTVSFRALSRREIERYVASGEPMDKAGAYAIQGLGSTIVTGIQGDYFNVVGLPLCRTVQMLAHFGVEVL